MKYPTPRIILSVLLCSLPFHLTAQQPRQRSPYYQDYLEQQNPKSPKGTKSAPKSQSATPNLKDTNTQKDISNSNVSSAPKNKQNGFYISLQTGYMYGEIQELIMAEKENQSSDLESQRTWKLQDTLTIGTNFDLIIQRHLFRLGIILPLLLAQWPMTEQTWKFDNPPGGHASYNYPPGAVSHYTISNTEKEFGFQAYGLYALNILKQQEQKAPRLELGLSVLYMFHNWRAFNTEGLYLLNNKGNSAHLRIPQSTNDTVRYQVHYLVPSITARFSTRAGIYGIEAWLNYSPSAIFWDTRENIFAQVTAKGFGALGQMFWGGINNYLWFTEKFAFHIGLRGKVLFRTRIGFLEQENQNTGTKENFPDLAGSEYFDIEAFLGLVLHL